MEQESFFPSLTVAQWAQQGAVAAWGIWLPVVRELMAPMATAADMPGIRAQPPAPTPQPEKPTPARVVGGILTTASGEDRKSVV